LPRQSVARWVEGRARVDESAIASTYHESGRLQMPRLADQNEAAGTADACGVRGSGPAGALR
ncbi:MAG TPA: hypothetical protein VK657_09250, partial [Terriglobales bacterium]|nr:hypothetical protein [Terriglobales bacterium]